MSFTKVSAPTALGTVLVTSNGLDASAHNNVTGATSGQVYQVMIDNTANTTQGVYFKLVDAASVTIGVTDADLVFYAPKGKKVTYAINTGHPYTSGVSIWCTTHPGTSNSSSPPSSVPVSLLAT